MRIEIYSGIARFSLRQQGFLVLISMLSNISLSINLQTWIAKETGRYNCCTSIVILLPRDATQSAVMPQ